MHKHPVQDEIFYVVDGKGVTIFEDRDDISVKTGSVFFIPCGLVHGVETADSERLILMLTKEPGITAKTAMAFMHGELLMHSPIPITAPLGSEDKYFNIQQNPLPYLGGFSRTL